MWFLPHTPPEQAERIARRGGVRATAFWTVLFILAGAGIAQAGFFTTGRSAMPDDPTLAEGRSIFENGAGGAVPACADCHGVNGQGDVAKGYPAIGGLQAAYLKAQFAAFVSGIRKSDTMIPIAKSLNGSDAADVAAYVAALPGIAATDTMTEADVGGPDLVRQGRILFQYGKKVSRTNWVPACRLCHGAEGQGTRAIGGETGYQFPPLWGPESYNWGAGMHSDAYFRDFIKGNMPLGQAGLLSDQDAADIAVFVNQPGHARPTRIHNPGQAPDF